MTERKLRSDKVGVAVECVVCHRVKKPVGRSSPLGTCFCDNDCDGYMQTPYAGSLWPGESEGDFGYPVSVDGTNQEQGQ